MNEVRPLQELASQLGADEFVARYPTLFLLKRPTPEPRGLEPTRFDYHTVSVRVDKAAPPDPYAGQWRVVEIQKRPQNPFPERISVGRTNNCDVVLRLPFISKLHAHFLIGNDGALRLVDNKSANGTALNGRALQAGETPEVVPGDEIAFGPLRLELMDARRLHAALTGPQAPALG
jgi:hypothetical protein